MLRILFRSHNQTADRCFHAFTKRLYCNKNLEPSAKPAEPSAEPLAQSIFRRMHDPSNFDKKVLLWVGRFKTAGEIPKSIPVDMMDRARNKARIKTCNYMILFTIIGCAFMAWEGKKAAARGESVSKMNLDWHKAIKDGKT